MAHQQRPNIILIFTDQHRLSAVGCYGDTPCQTPNIDQLAREGVRFETAYTACPVCSPARATIMTGLYPHAHGVTTNVHTVGCSVHELGDRPELLSRCLQSAGYQCGYSGKWHLGTDLTSAFQSPNTPSLPKDVGFHGQNFPGHGGGGFHYPEYKAYLAENGFSHVVESHDQDQTKEVLNYGGILQGPVESTVPYYLSEHTISLVDRFSRSDQPFFIWHNFWGPHTPRFATREFYELYKGVEIPKWPNYRWDARATNTPLQVKINPYIDQLTWEDWAEAVRFYYAFTSLIDQQIGRICDHLEEAGLLENTIIIFTADHGETLGSHGGLMDKGWHHFEEIQRIPLIVRPPKSYAKSRIENGAVLPQWISLADLYPTILDMAGAEFRDSELHGRSFLPILQGQQTLWRDTIAVEFCGVNHLAATMISLRKDNIKFGWNCSSWDELYDLDEDPYEMNNLVADAKYSRTLAEMRQLLADWMAETEHPALFMYTRSRLGHY